MLGSPNSGVVVIRCACCERRLSRSEDRSCAGCSRSTIRRSRVDISAVVLSGLYVSLARESRRCGRFAGSVRCGRCVRRRG